MIGPASLISGMLGAVALGHGAVWLAQALVALPRPRPKHDGDNTSPLRTVVIIPAHNEEGLVRRCVESLASDGSRVPFEIIVVADNCTDTTAELAAAAGATVLIRNDDERRGKPFALDFALQFIREERTPPQLVVFVDADSYVGPRFLDRMAEAARAGADVVQCHYLPESGASDLAKLRELAFSLVHWVRPLGAARLGLGTSLKGNGMALRWELVANGMGAGGITEDAEMTLRLAELGVAVRFQPQARVTGHMAHTYEEATTQDLRWEAGRGSLRWRALRSAGRALLHGQPGAAAGAVEVAALPLSAALAFGVASLAVGVLARSAVSLVGAGAIGLLTAYVTVGWISARVPMSTARALLGVPRFAWHKVRVHVRIASGRGPTTWDRTSRS